MKIYTVSPTMSISQNNKHIRKQLCQAIGTAIAHIRIRHGISQTELSLRTNISQPRISEIEHGECNIIIKTFCDILDNLGTNQSEFIIEFNRIFYKTKQKNYTQKPLQSSRVV